MWAWEGHVQLPPFLPLLQVSLMQHELEALRQGLSGRQAAALEAARAEFASALQEAQAELEAVRQRACEHGLTAARQGKALASIMRFLAVHAGEDAAAAGAAGSEGVAGVAAAAAAGPDPAKAVAFVEAVSATMLDLQQQWQLERAEMAQVGACCGMVLACSASVSSASGSQGKLALKPPLLSRHDCCAPHPATGTGGGGGGALPAGGAAGAGAV